MKQKPQQRFKVRNSDLSYWKYTRKEVQKLGTVREISTGLLLSSCELMTVVMIVLKRFYINLVD